MSPEIRIGAGRFKGRRLRSFAGGYRPTAAIVKKSLFDILGEDIEGCRFLDLFAGCGAVGLEALSRGAGRVCFVEIDNARAGVTRENLKKLGVDLEFETAACEIMATDYSVALRLLGERDDRFHFIYVDPPYEGTSPQRILGDIVASRVLEEDGRIIYETTRGDVRKLIEPRHGAPGELYPLREYLHGGTALVFFRWREGFPATGLTA